MTHDRSDDPPQTSRLRHAAVRFVPYLLIIAAFALRLSSITFQSLWRDEVDAIRFALAPLPDLIKTFTQPGFNGPLYFGLLRGWIALAGQSELAIRFLSLIFGTLGVALIITLGRRLFNRPIGLMAGTLLTFSAYQVWYSQEAKMYTLITALALLAIYCLRRSLEEGRIRFWIGVVAATSLAMYAHILAALLIPVEVVLFVLWWPLSRRHLRAGLIALAFLTVPYIPLARWQLPLIFVPAETGFTHYTFGRMLSTLGAAYSLGILNPSLSGGWNGVVSGLTAALATLGLLNLHQSTGKRLALLSWTALPVLAIFVVSINRPIFTDRYVIWIQPAYYFLIALGLAAVWRWWRPLAPIGLALLVGASALGLQAQATIPYKSDFRSAAAAIERQIQAGDMIVFQIPYVQYTFDYYYHQPYEAIPGPYTNYPGSNNGYRDSAETIDQQLAAIFSDKRGVWLVASEVSMWDQRDLLRKWLNAHGQVTYQADFAQVQITRYELPPETK
jgi:mannosyltransferase